MIKTAKLQCPRCKAILTLKQEIQVTCDVTCVWSEQFLADSKSNIATVTPDGALLIKITTKEHPSLMLSIPLGKDVPTELGPQTFELRQIYPGVVKLQPSIADPKWHGFVTIVGVPPNYKELLR